MKKITFNVPDNTIIMHCLVVSDAEVDGKNVTNLNAEFYDLRTGQTEFTPQTPGNGGHTYADA